MKRYLQSVEEVVKALKEGKKIFEKDGDLYYQMKDGFICCFYCNTQDITINCGIVLEKDEDKYYTEEPEQLKFEVNKLYKTRSGHKAFLDFKATDGMSL